MEGSSRTHKRARISTGPRNRSGCLPCKQRHVKCSESKPVCDGCLRAGTKCAYAGPTPPVHTRRRREPSQFVFREPWAPTSSLSVTLTAPMRRKLDDMGYRVLRYFHEKTIPTISHFLPASFWTGTLLQMSESIPAITHCILALGSWHLTIDTSQNTAIPTGIARSNDTLRFSEDSYDKALSALTKEITGTSSTSSPIEVAVTASVLLAMYASLRGDQTQLVTHVRLGLNLARESTASSSPASVVEFNRRQLALLRLEEEMRAPIFDSLRISAGEDTLADVLTTNANCGPGIGSVSIDAVAADVLNMGNAVYRFARKCNIGMYANDEPALLYERERLQAQCIVLRDQMSRACFPESTQLGLKILRARLELAWIMLQAGWELRQTAFDEFQRNFDLILYLAEEVLRSAGPRRQRLPFSVNLGLIPLLFYVSRLCREPALRRKAADLLDDCPTIEGMWNAREAAAIARFVIALEEETEEDIGGEDANHGDWEHQNVAEVVIIEEKRIHSLRFGASIVDGNTSTMDMLDVTVMTRPREARAALQNTSFRISAGDWASGRGKLCNAIQL